MESKIRVHVCSETGKEVLQEKLKSGEWLCLHNENPEDDAKEVEKFKSKK